MGVGVLGKSLRVLKMRISNISRRHFDFGGQWLVSWLEEVRFQQEGTQLFVVCGLQQASARQAQSLPI